MKVITLLFLAILILPNASMADKIEVETADLDRDTLKRVMDKRGRSDNIRSEVSAWAGIGKEVGTAVNEALGAVVDNAEKFGTTKVGTITIYLVIWKIIGQQLLFTIMGAIGWIITLAILIWSYRRTCISRRILVEKSKDGKKWAVVNPPYDISIREQRESLSVMRVVHVLLFVVACIAGMLAVFAH